jgi:hypothetical protein
MSRPATCAAVALFLTAAPALLRAQAGALPPLGFLGFEAGAPLPAVRARIASLGGRSLDCDRAARDRSVRDCRTTVFEPGNNRPLAVWLSTIDDRPGILTLSRPLSAVELEGWKQALETSFGMVDARVQGTQSMMQWVRQGRMLRLTWRTENGARVASVSLVDGRVLDAWGRDRAKANGGRTNPTPTASP